MNHRDPTRRAPDDAEQPCDLRWYLSPLGVALLLIISLTAWLPTTPVELPAPAPATADATPADALAAGLSPDTPLPVPAEPRAEPVLQPQAAALGAQQVAAARATTAPPATRASRHQRIDDEQLPASEAERSPTF